MSKKAESAGTAETPGRSGNGTAKEAGNRASAVAELEAALGPEPEGETDADAADEPEGIDTSTLAGGRGAREERAPSRTAKREIIEDEDQAPEGETETDNEPAAAEDDGDPAAVDMPDVEAQADDEETKGDEDAPAEERSEAELEKAQLEQLAEAKGWPRSARKRLFRLLQQKHALQAQLAGVTGVPANADADAAPGGAAPADADASAESAGGNISTLQLEETLQEEITSKERWLETLDAALDRESESFNPAGLEIADEKTGQKRLFPLDQVRAARRRFERDLARAETRLESVRERNAQAAQAYEKRARQQHAFMRDPKSAERRAIAQIVQLFPDVQRIPDHVLVLADAFAWRALQASKAKANGNGNTHGNAEEPVKKKLALRPPLRPGAVPARVNGRRQELAGRETEFAKTGSREAGAKLIESMI